MADTPKQNIRPRYKLTERAYIEDVLHEEGAEIEFDGIPGHHMEPLNAPAKELVKKHNPKYVNPIDELTIV